MIPAVSNTFETHRAKLIGLAYRITGSKTEAEDIVQEAFIKWAEADQQSIEKPQAWLMTVVSRMALDHLKSAKVKRVSYIGPWLPEPFIDDDSAENSGLTSETTPEQALELEQSISMALMVLLEQLSPAERAAFILHDVFHYDFTEIGSILRKTEVACRKLASRARSKVDHTAFQNKHDKEEHLQVLNSFLHAVKQGDTQQLVNLFEEDVVFHSDGGGKAVALRQLLCGSEAVIKFLVKVVRPNIFPEEPGDIVIKTIWFNGSPGLVVWEQGKPISAFNLELHDGVIKTIHALRNPDKLRLFYTSETE